MVNVENFKRVSKMCDDIFEAKNADYGNAIDVTYALSGNDAILVRLWDKLLRLTNLAKSGKACVNESFADTLLDLRNYAQIAYIQSMSEVPTLSEAFGEFEKSIIRKVAGINDNEQSKS